MEYKVPAKNLTPYYHIPKQALTVLTKLCKESPEGARSLELTLLGAPNAGKSSLFNYLVDRQISAVSNKVNTTDEAVLGVYTDLESRAQLVINDTPGVTKASQRLRSQLLVTKAWQTVKDSEHVVFVVDSCKRLSFEVRGALSRLQKISVDPTERRIMQAMLDESFTEEAFQRGDYDLTLHEKELAGQMPVTLVLNKVDLLTNKRRLRSL